jgi:hypothetical protein
MVYRVAFSPQAVKSEAMGPRHVTTNIPTIAAGPLVKELIQDAHLGESKGWFWTYRLKSIKASYPPQRPCLSSDIANAMHSVVLMHVQNHRVATF